MMAVQILSPEVIRNLRSGEAVTSVANCVEELVWNAVDANADCIAIRLNLPFYKIQVIDNGHGITSEQMQLVGKRYATSKCHTLDDLQNVKYGGFRGEALSSLKVVSSALVIESRSHSSVDSYCKIFRKGTVSKLMKSIVPRKSKGTTVTVLDFMYNMPVRQQLISDALDTEQSCKVLQSIALMHPNISFSLRNDSSGEICFQVKQCNSLYGSFAQLFGKEKVKNLQEICHVVDDYEIKGYISTECQSSKDLQFLYINKRLVLQTKLHKLLNNLLNHVLLKWHKFNSKSDASVSNSQSLSHCKYSVFVINITCPYNLYDIVFDPKKTSVEFLEWDKVLEIAKVATLKFLIDKCNITINDMKSGVYSDLNEMDMNKMFDNNSYFDKQSFDELSKDVSDFDNMHLNIECYGMKKNECNIDKLSHSSFNKYARGLASKIEHDNVHNHPPILNHSLNCISTPNSPEICNTSFENHFSQSDINVGNGNKFALLQETGIIRKRNVEPELRVSKRQKKCGNNVQNENINGCVSSKPTFSHPVSYKDNKNKASQYEFGQDIDITPLKQLSRSNLTKKKHLTGANKKDYCSLDHSYRNLKSDTKNCDALFFKDSSTTEHQKSFCPPQQYVEEKNNILNNCVSCCLEDKMICDKIDANSFISSLCNSSHSDLIIQQNSGYTTNLSLIKMNDNVSQEILSALNPCSFLGQTDYKSLILPAVDFNSKCNIDVFKYLIQCIVILSTYFGRTNALILFQKVIHYGGIQNSCLREDQVFKYWHILNSFATDMFERKIKLSVFSKLCSISNFYSLFMHYLFTFHPFLSSLQLEKLTIYCFSNVYKFYSRMSEICWINEQTLKDRYAYKQSNEIELKTCCFHILNGNSKNNIKNCCYCQSLRKSNYTTSCNVIARFPLTEYKKNLYSRTITEKFSHHDTGNCYQSSYVDTIKNGMLCSKRDLLKSEHFPHTYNLINSHRFSKDTLTSLQVIGQVDCKFIACVFQDNNSKTKDKRLLVLFDQHAVDERVRLEQLSKDIYEDNVTKRKVKYSTIHPFIKIRFESEELRLLDACRESLAEIGIFFNVKKSSYLATVYAVPSFLVEKNVLDHAKNKLSFSSDVEKIIRETIRNFKETRSASSVLPKSMTEILNSKACKGAVKFGDQLSLSQCERLFYFLSKCRLPFQCAHGRPSIAPILHLENLKPPNKKRSPPKLWRLTK